MDLSTDDVLNDVLTRLKQIDDVFWGGEQSKQFVEIIQNSNTIGVRSNVAGFIHIAYQILRLAERGISGIDYCLDEASIADRADISITFSFQNAPWDSK